MYSIMIELVQDINICIVIRFGKCYGSYCFKRPDIEVMEGK